LLEFAHTNYEAPYSVIFSIMLILSLVKYSPIFSAPEILYIEVGFPQSLQEDTWIYSILPHDRFLPLPFQFVIH
jgi:hypothetical protein